MAADNEPLFARAAARVYIRRNASSHSLGRIKSHLQRRARDGFEFAQWGDWTIIDLASRQDLLSLRRRFPSLLDGWREFP